MNAHGALSWNSLGDWSDRQSLGHAPAPPAAATGGSRRAPPVAPSQSSMQSRLLAPQSTYPGLPPFHSARKTQSSARPSCSCQMLHAPHPIAPARTYVTSSRLWPSSFRPRKATARSKPATIFYATLDKHCPRDLPLLAQERMSPRSTLDHEVGDPSNARGPSKPDAANSHTQDACIQQRLTCAAGGACAVLRDEEARRNLTDAVIARHEGKQVFIRLYKNAKHSP